MFVYPKRYNYLQTQPPAPRPSNNPTKAGCCCIPAILSQRDSDFIAHDGRIIAKHLGPTWKIRIEKKCYDLEQAVSQGESLEIFCSALEKAGNCRLLSLPMMCIMQALERRRFRSSRRGAQWIAVELATATGGAQVRGDYGLSGLWKVVVWQVAAAIYICGCLYMCERQSQSDLELFQTEKLMKDYETKPCLS